MLVWAADADPISNLAFVYFVRVRVYEERRKEQEGYRFLKILILLR